MPRAGKKKNTRPGLAGTQDDIDALKATLPLTEDTPRGTPRPASTSLPKALRDRYTVRRVLGFGGFGIVLLAKDVVIGRLVAIKQLYQQMEGNPKIVQRLLQEARIAGKLSHPHIVSIYTVEQVDQALCIVMEYLGGGNLGELITASKTPLPLETTINIITAILEGLKAAHGMGVVHRDLKPENILFDNMGVPKISDFGLAHLPKEGGGVVQDANTTGLGTPLYMAPEQFKRGKTLDSRSDLYSVGAMLYETLVGKRFHNLRRLRDIENPKDMPTVSQVIPELGWAPGVPPSLKRIVAKLVHDDPDARFQTINEALRVLRPFGSPRDTNFTKMTGVMHAGAGYALTNIDILRDILELLLTDGILKPDEREELDRRADRLGIDRETAVQIEEDLRSERGLPSLAAIQEYRALVGAVLKHGKLSLQHRSELNTHARRLGITQEEQASIEEYYALRRTEALERGAATESDSSEVGIETTVIKTRRP